MKGEIYEIPYRAELCYSKNKGILLPEDVPYLGMGNSHTATSIFKYLGIKLYSQTASDYIHYFNTKVNKENAVLISQSGRSTETLKCADDFKSFIGIVNNSNSPLCSHKNCSRVVELMAGTEEFFPTKTYINTLLLLYLGFGLEPGNALNSLKNGIQKFEKQGIELANFIYRPIKRSRINGIFILGNGVNKATAEHVALVLNQASKYPVSHMSVSQYNHGFKESAKDSIVIAINPEGQEYSNTKGILVKIKSAGASIFELNDIGIEESFSPLLFPMPFYFASELLSKKLGKQHPFVVGEKVTIL